MRMPMFIIQQIQRIQSMDETAQNAPVGICMEQIANAINIVGHLYGSMSFRSQSQLFYPR